MEHNRDPEILKLSQEIHNLTGQIKVLLSEIDKASVLLLVRVEKTKNEELES